jgi:hypothetical protein
MSTFIIISVGIFLISLVILTSCLGIYLSKKYEVIGNLSSKRNTLILIVIFNLIVFFTQFQQTQNLVYSITFAMGYVLGMPFTMGYVGTFVMKRILKNYLISKKDYWSSSFFSLIWVGILILKE